MSIQLDPLTGLPVDLTDTNFGQLPLNSQPLNLDDLGALGKQSNWLYPDNIIPTLSHLQAQNTPGANTAQSLSTDGKHNLNVNLAGNTTGSGAPIVLPPWTTIYLNHGSSGFADVYYSMAPCPEFLYGLVINGNAVGPANTDLGGLIQLVADDGTGNNRIPLACLRSVGKTPVAQSCTVIFPQPLALAQSLGNPDHVEFQMLNPGIDWDISLVLHTSSSVLGP